MHRISSQFLSSCAVVIAVTQSLPAMAQLRDVAAPAAATASGIIIGEVVGAGTGTPLEGVIVRVRDGGQSAVTDTLGRFRIANLSLGQVEFELIYVGLPVTRVSVSVVGDVPQSQTFQLGEGNEIIVTGQRGAQAAALSEQRAAGNTRNVVSADQAGRFPDKNAAEALRRVPGVSVAREEKGGDGRYISIRGLDSGLNSFKINGFNAAQPEEETRRVPLDVIQTAVLSKITVNKTLLPDQEADGIGGAVELDTATAFDFGKDLLELSVSGFHNDFAGGVGPFVQATGAAKFGRDDRFGILLSGTYSKRESLGFLFRHNSSYAAVRRGDPASGQTLVDYRLNSFENERENIAVQAGFDWQMSDATILTLKGSYNRLFDIEINRAQYFVGAASYDTTGALIRTGRGRVSVYGEYEESEFTQQSYVAEVRSQAGDFTLEGTLGFAMGNRDEPNDYEVRFDTRVDANLLDYAQPNAPFPVPALSAADRGIIANPASYTLGSNDIDADRAINERYGVTLDAIWAPIGGTGTLSYLKGGVKVERSHRDLFEANVFNLSGPLTLNQFGTGPEFSYARLGAVPYAPFPTLDVGRLRNWRVYSAGLVANDSRFRNAYVLADGRIALDEDTYTSNEDTYAAYLMAKLQFGGLEVIGGTRLDHTRLKSRNFELLRLSGAVPTVRPIETRASYTYVLPRIQANYRWNDRLVARAAVFTSIARPEFQYVSAATEIIQSGGLVDVRIGNPDLTPAYSWNFDAGIEYYFERLGYVAANGFYKNIDGFIFNETAPTESVDRSAFLNDPRLGGRPLGQVFQFRNGNRATVYGVEVALVRQFTELPGWLGGFGVYANLTAQKSSADLGLPNRGKTAFFNAPGQIYTVAGTYEKYGIEASAAYSYRSSYLNELTDFNQGFWARPYGSLDVKVQYALTSRIKLFVNAVDVLDGGLQPINDFRLGTDEGPGPLLREATYNGRSATFGATVRF